MLGALIGGALGAFSQERTNKANAKQAAQQMDFQREMSNTAHQREVADLRAAGLNPILSGTGGGGASSPAGAQATMGDTGAAALEGASSALSTSRSAELSQADKWDVKRRQFDMERSSYAMKTDEARYRHSERRAKAEADEMEADAERARYEAELAKYSAYDSSLDYDLNRLGEGMPEKIRRGLGRGADTIGSILPSGPAARALLGGGGHSAAAQARREPAISGLTPKGPKLRPGEKLDPETGEITGDPRKKLKVRRMQNGKMIVEER